MRRIFLGCATAMALTACGDPIADESLAADPRHGLALIDRAFDPANGRQLFVEKGCVICHAVNGVGGKAATPLDAPIGAPPIDAIDFAARMWRGAPAMIELQSIELGYTIYLEADDLADLAAFAADREEQKLLEIDQLPENVRAGLLDEQFWEMEDWDDFLRAGQEQELDAEEGAP